MEQKKIPPKINKQNKTVTSSRVTSGLSLGMKSVVDATLISDSLDYQPGSTATVTGTGFQSGETVKVQVLHVDHQPGDPIGDDHEPWDVVADASGNFTTTWHVCEDDCLGQQLNSDCKWAIIKFVCRNIFL
jgi:hypothetical protein